MKKLYLKLMGVIAVMIIFMTLPRCSDDDSVNNTDVEEAIWEQVAGSTDAIADTATLRKMYFVSATV